MQTASREDVKRMIDADANIHVVEVLAPDAFRKFHLPHATNVPLGDQFDDQIQRAVPNKSDPVIVYCQNTQCNASPTAAKRMDELGYERVYDYEAGKDDWKQAGLPTEA